MAIEVVAVLLHMVRVLGVVVALFLSAACEDESGPPEKPPLVPEAAVWAGGVDGGHWFICNPRSEQGKYICQIYSDYLGDLVAKGEFILRKVKWEDNEKKAYYFDVEEDVSIIYEFFDGSQIYLKDNYALLPHGIIDFPFDKKSGKKAEFNLGIQLGPDIEYHSDD